MAKKALTFIDLVTSADTETLRAALEARSKIDELLVVRAEAYRQIYELEEQVNSIVGDESSFEFDEPEFPVAFGGKSPKKKPAPKPKAPKDETPEDTSSDPADEESVEETPESSESTNKESSEEKK